MAPIWDEPTRKVPVHTHEHTKIYTRKVQANTHEHTKYTQRSPGQSTQTRAGPRTKDRPKGVTASGRTKVRRTRASQQQQKTPGPLDGS